MYLSKLALNPRSAEARRDLARPYELHRTLAQAFLTAEGQDYRAAHQVLFRIESGSGLPVVLVQSATLPDWSYLPPDYLRESAQCRPFTPQFTRGQVLGFRLVANPTKKVSREGRRQGNRVPLLDAGGDEDGTPAHQWLHRKAAQSGFTLLHLFSDDFSLGTAPRRMGGTRADKQDLPLYGVRFDGMLQVTDPELLTAALTQGIGSAKAFGFGLLSLALPAARPPQST